MGSMSETSTAPRRVHKQALIPDVDVVVPGWPVSAGLDPKFDPLIPCVWYDVDGGTPCVVRFFGTGHEIPDQMVFLATVITPVGLVWHVFWDVVNKGNPQGDCV